MEFDSRAVFLLFFLLPVFVSAEDSADAIDEIVVSGQSVSSKTVVSELEQKLIVDTAAALKEMPGANVNSNGSITGIAQYRGMYGDRVAVTIDEHAIVSGGPNAMDAPLSYVSPMIAEDLVVERGIASVSSAPESIGGHLRTNLARGSFGGEEMSLSGFVGSRYYTNGDVTTTAGRLTVSNNSHRFSAIASLDDGQNLKTPVGEIRPSTIDRRRFDVSYAYTDGDSPLVVFAGRLDTRESGTPALPMAIRYIDTILAGGHFLLSLTPGLSIEGHVSANDVEHLMDNFTLRSAPPAMRQRKNYATGSSTSAALAARIDLDPAILRIGIDGTFSDHDSTITNPNDSAFRVNNFSAVHRDLTSIFGEWRVEHGVTELELGVRLKRVTTDAGEIGAMGMMNPAIGMLTDAFNSSERKLSFNDIDAVAKYRYRSSDAIEWLLEVARKSRAPSYQELYLWLPLQATGGLADGRTYIGDLDLDSEISNELNVGVLSTFGRLTLSPQVFYKRVSDYIQGTPSTNAAANMVAMMMTGQPTLQFSNTDAEIWGLDLAWSFPVSDRLTLDGVGTYARGRRTDIADNLYRLAPLSGSIGLSYAGESWRFDTRIVASVNQNKVAAFNDEQESDGYSIVNAGLTWMPTPSFQLQARIDNIFDATYQDHLGGINRAGGSDVAVGTRLYGAERNLGVGVIFSF